MALLSNIFAKIIGIGQQPLKLSLLVVWYTFWDTVYIIFSRSSLGFASEHFALA